MADDSLSADQVNARLRSPAALGVPNTPPAPGPDTLSFDDVAKIATPPTRSSGFPVSGVRGPRPGSNLDINWGKIGDRLNDAAEWTGLGGLKRGYQASAANLYNTLGNAVDAYRGLVGNDAVPGLDDYSQALRDMSKRVGPAPAPTDSFWEKLNQAIGGTPLTLAEYAGAGEVLGPTKGMATLGGLQEADKGPLAAARGAAEGALTGAAMHVTEPLAVVPRVATLATVGGAQAAADGGDAKDIAANALLMAGLGVPGHASGVRLRDIPAMAVEHYLPGGDRAARVEPTIGTSTAASAPEGNEPTLNVPGSLPAATVGPEMLSPMYVAPAGKPGLSIEDAPHGLPMRNAVYRDQAGKPIGVLRFQLAPDGQIETRPGIAKGATVYVAEPYRRQGIATQLYDFAKAQGFNVDQVSGRYDTSPAGAAFAATRQPPQPGPTLNVGPQGIARPGGVGASPGAQPSPGTAPAPTTPETAPAPAATPSATDAQGDVGKAPSPGLQTNADDEAVGAAAAQAGLPAAGSRTTVTAPGGRKITVAPKVVEADSLVTSHNNDLMVNPAFPAELQPRDRSRAASEVQIGDLARNLDPALLGASPTTTDSAPIVGPDGVVESGNARVLAIRRAYDQHPQAAQRYRQALIDQGYDVSGMKAPVLVRQRTTDLAPTDRAKFAAESNQRTTLGMSATEQAQADARRLPDWALDFYKGGDVGSAANREFVMRFAALAVPPNELGTFMGRLGDLSQDGRRRLENALFALAYDSPELLAKMREGTDSNVAGIGNAMINSAGAWAKLREDVETGRVRSEMDVTPALTEAVNLVDRARQQGTPLADLVRQRDAFSGAISPETEAVLRLMFRDDNFKRPASRQAVAAALRYYADQARKATTDKILDLGDAAASPLDILKLAANRGSGDLLGAAAAESRVPTEAAQAAATGRTPTTAELRALAHRVASRAATTKPDTLSFEDAHARDGQARDGQARPPQSMDAGPANAAAADTLPTEGVANMTPGANYTGSVRDKYDPAVAVTKDPVRREKILADFVKAVGMPLYQGRVRGKSEGFYRPHVGEVRIKRSNDLETAIHEWAHLIDDKFPEIRRQWNPATAANKAVRDELRGVSYDKTKLFEGFAEAVRLWATQPQEAAAKAPIFNGWFNDFVTRNPHGDAFLKFRDQATAWFDQAAVDRARSKIGGDQAINAGITRIWDKFRQGTVDDLHGIKHMEETTTGTLSPVGAYETARLTRAKASIVEGMLKLGRIQVKADGSHEFVGKGLKQILKPVADRLDDYLMYAVGRSANELMGQNREHLFTKAEIKGMLALRTPELDQAFAEYQEWNKAVLDFAQAKGVIDPVARSFFARSQYLPFHRVSQPGAYSKVPGDWKGIKALTGGTDNLRDVLGNMIQNAVMLTDAALTNEARDKVADLSRRQMGAQFMAKIPTEERGIKIPKDEVERVILEALGVTNKKALPVDQQAFVDQITDNLGGLVDVFLRNQAPTGHNVVAVLRAGKPEYYEVADPILLRSLTMLKRPPAPWVVRALGLPRRVGQATVTLTADFMAANIIRDTVMAGIMSRSGFRPIINSAIGLKSRLAHDQNYKDFIANGGGLSSQLLDEKAFRRHLERYYGRKGINYKTVLDTPMKLLDGLEHLADAFEMSTRLGEYRRAVQQGENARHAAYRAREVSTDFAMRGDSKALGFLFDSVMFMKAGAVSMDRAYRGFAEDKNRVRIGVMTGMLALASMGLYALNRSNPLYQQLEDWDRDANWHVFVPTLKALRAWHEGRLIANQEAYLHLRLPRLWEIGAVGAIAERSLEAILNKAPGQGALNILNVIRQQFNLGVIPQALKPLYEVATNRDSFTGSPIVTQAEQELQPWAQAGTGTSETMRAVGYAERHLPTALQFSPAEAEHLLRGYFNTWATYGLSLSDAIGFDNKPDMRLDQMPVVRRFFSAEPARNTRYVTELFDAIKAATDARQTMHRMDRIGQSDVAGELENTPDNLAYNQMQFADKHMREIRADMEQVHQADGLDATRKLAMERAKIAREPNLVATAQQQGAWNSIGALKRFLLDDLTAERNAFAKAVMDDVHAH